MALSQWWRRRECYEGRARGLTPPWAARLGSVQALFLAFGKQRSRGTAWTTGRQLRYQWARLCQRGQGREWAESWVRRVGLQAQRKRALREHWGWKR